MNYSNEQVKTIASDILVKDIIDYIDLHSSEYEEFCRKEVGDEN